MQKKLTVPLFSQRDAKWAKLKLGTSNTTIGDFGCLLTCCSMLAKFYGKDNNPDSLNKLFIQNNSYQDGNLYKWYEGLPKVYPDIDLTALVDTPNAITAAQFKLMREEINNHRPVILQVDFYPSTAQPDMHFVLLTGYDDKNYYVADPYYGDVSNLNRYGDPKATILQYAFHSGVTSLPTQPEEYLKLELDMPAFVEDKYDLKSKSWYNKYWTLHDFIKDSIDTHRSLEHIEDELEKLKRAYNFREGVIEDRDKTIKSQTEHLERVQLASAELTAQMAIMSEQVKTAIREKTAATDALAILKDEKKLVDDDIIKLTKEITILEQRLSSGIKAYSKSQLFWAWLLGA